VVSLGWVGWERTTTVQAVVVALSTTLPVAVALDMLVELHHQL
jgi:chromate transport protein ChrA